MVVRMETTVEPERIRPGEIGQGSRSSATRRVAAVATALVGALSLLSAVTPDVPWRRHLLLAVEPGPVMALGHVLATLGGLALVYVGWGILRSRRRAVNVAIVGLAALALLHAAKGLDYEEAALALTLALLLYLARRSCTRGGEPGRGVIAATVALGAVALGYTLDVAVLLATGREHELGSAITDAAGALDRGAWWVSSGGPTAIAL